MKDVDFMPKRFKPFYPKPGSFKGNSFYSRGGKTKDKYGNVQLKPLTFRSNHTGVVISNHGKYLGIEANRRHTYGVDPRRVQFPKKYQTARQKLIMMKLRQSGRL